MTTAAARERDTEAVSEEIEPKFIVRLVPEKDGGLGVVEIRARSSYRTHDDVNRWLRACVRDVAIKLEEIEGSDVA